MDIREFQAIDAIVRNRSISRAAETLNISQQALSSTVKKLEGECGFPIFSRTSKGSELTEQGEQLYRYLVPVLTEYQLAVNKISAIRQKSGDAIRLGVSIGAFHTIDYKNGNALLKKFREAYPNTHIASYEYPDRIIEEMLVRDELDCALTLKPRMKGLMFNKLEDVTMSVYLGTNHHLADRKVLTFKELKEERFAMVTRDMQFSDLTIERCLSAGFRPNVVFVASDIFSIIAKIKTGDSIFIGMDKIPLEEGLTKVRLDEPEFYWTLCMVYTKNTLMDKKKSRILRHMSDFFRMSRK